MNVTAYDTWTQMVVTLPSTATEAGVYQLALFCNFGNWGQIYLYIDDVSIY
jgi:hypothetical protein